MARVGRLGLGSFALQRVTGSVTGRWVGGGEPNDAWGASGCHPVVGSPLRRVSRLSFSVRAVFLYCPLCLFPL